MEIAIYQSTILILIPSSLYLLYRYHKLKESIKTRKNTIELSDFIRDLANGGAMLSVRVDPEHIFTRSPRG